MSVYQQLPKSFNARATALLVAWERTQLPQQLVSLGSDTLGRLAYHHQHFVPLVQQRGALAGG